MNKDKTVGKRNRFCRRILAGDGGIKKPVQWHRLLGEAEKRWLAGLLDQGLQLFHVHLTGYVVHAAGGGSVGFADEKCRCAE